MRGNVPVRFGRGSPGRTQDHLVPRLAAYLVGRLQGEGAQVTDAHNPGGMRNAEHRNGLRVLSERDRVANTAQGHWRATYAERCMRGSEGGARKRVSHLRETPRRAPYPVLWSYRSGIRTSASTNSDHGGDPARRPRLTGTTTQRHLWNPEPRGPQVRPFGP